MPKLKFVAFVFAIALSGSALAQSAAPRGSCKADYDKFCAGVAPGTGQVVACLQAKRDQLSATCRTVLDSRKKK